MATEHTPTALTTRPGGPSAKKTHQDGAPNHQHGSGETPMVSTTPADVPTLAQVQAHLIATKPQWLTTRPNVIVSITRLASVVHALLTAHVTPLRLEADTIAEQVWTLATTNGALQNERDAARRESDLREQEIIALTVERDRALAEVDRLDTEKTELGAGIVARDREIIALTADLEQADAQLAELRAGRRGDHQ